MTVRSEDKKTTNRQINKIGNNFHPKILWGDDNNFKNEEER